MKPEVDLLLITCFGHLVFPNGPIHSGVSTHPSAPDTLWSTEMSGQQRDTVFIDLRGSPSTKISWLWSRIAVSFASFGYSDRCES